MTPENVRKIFADKITGDRINFPNGSYIEIDNFLNVFTKAPDNPTKEDLLAIDEANKGYAELIEQGNYS